MKKLSRYTVVALSALVVALILSYFLFFSDWSVYKVEQSISRGNHIVGLLERYLRDFGRLPRGLHELNSAYVDVVENPSAGAGNWEYTVHDDGPTFELSFRSTEFMPSYTYNSEYPGMGWYRSSFP